MANVNPVDGIVYGFRLLGYLLVVFLAGGLITFIGADSGDTAGAFITFLGSLIILAGFLGIQFKLISDGVERGIRASQGTAPEGEGLSGLPFIGDAVGGQGRRRQRGQQNRQQRGQQNQRQRGEQRSRQNRDSAVSNSRASGTADKVVSNRASKDGNGGTSRVRTEPRADRVGKC